MFLYVNVFLTCYFLAQMYIRIDFIIDVNDCVLVLFIFCRLPGNDFRNNILTGRVGTNELCKYQAYKFLHLCRSLYSYL